MAHDHQWVEVQNSLLRMELDADIRASHIRYEASLLTMWMAWTRVAEVREHPWPSRAFEYEQYSNTHLDPTAVHTALVHAAGDPECAIWVHRGTSALTAWPAFESPRDWTWSILEDFRDSAAVPPGWAEMTYNERLAALLADKEDIQLDWEATFYEIRADEAIRTQYSERRNQEYLNEVAQTPRD